MSDGPEKKRRKWSWALVAVLMPVALVGGGCWLLNDHPVVSRATAMAELDSAVDGSLGAINPPLSSASLGSYDVAPDVQFTIDLTLKKTGTASFSRQQVVLTDIVPAKFATFREQEEKYWRSHGYTDIHEKTETTMGGHQHYLLSATSPAGVRIAVTLGHPDRASADVMAIVDWVEFSKGGTGRARSRPGPRSAS
ncbi:hypothetical protein E6W39_17885 [Kitasatospora acidiphila]|uniref:Uncharacterized protein n=1 Tax=Kitasatospora acidiphila TaxID=2567942 RepID=A0A540W403_9ACTN|nr:hypothetical protein [Kitasatospora acidiphila]TQF03761.1 hypothetical protein E6W39_17885 [Kitasatospora acidiphila]